MDEEKISIVLRESFAMNMESYISLYSINIDLVSGELMDNGNMIDYTPKLAKAFRDQMCIRDSSYGHAVTEDGESQTAEPAENRVFRKEGSSHMVDEHTDDSHQL